MTDEQLVAVSAFIPASDHERLKEIASREGRSLTKQLSWLIARYLQAEKDDGA